MKGNKMAGSIFKMLPTLGIAGRERKTVVCGLGEAGEKVSTWVWNRREELGWGPVVDGQ